MVFRKVVRFILCQKTEKPLTCDLSSKKNSEKRKKHLPAFLLKIMTVSWIGLKESIYCAFL